MQNPTSQSYNGESENISVGMKSFDQISDEDLLGDDYFFSSKKHRSLVNNYVISNRKHLIDVLKTLDNEFVKQIELMEFQLEISQCKAVPTEKLKSVGYIYLDHGDDCTCGHHKHLLTPDNYIVPYMDIYSIKSSIEIEHYRKSISNLCSCSGSGEGTADGWERFDEGGDRHANLLSILNERTGG